MWFREFCFSWVALLTLWCYLGLGRLTFPPLSSTLIKPWCYIGAHCAQPAWEEESKTGFISSNNTNRSSCSDDALLYIVQLFQILSIYSSIHIALHLYTWYIMMLILLMLKLLGRWGIKDFMFYFWFRTFNVFCWHNCKNAKMHISVKLPIYKVTLYGSR